MTIRRNLNIILSLLILIFSSCESRVKDKTDRNVISQYKPSLEEFKDIKFGLFIHWGLYAIPGGVWNGKEIPAMSEHIMRGAKIPIQEYEKLAAKFNPIHFNPDEWVKLAKDAGMKYMVITAKHHDGFAMYDSKVSDYNIVDATPYKKDPIKILAKVCAENDIKFGFYYSHSRDWHESNAAGNTWDFKTPEKDRDLQSYMQKKALPQIEELLKNYGPLFLIWYDTPDLLTKSESKQFYDIVKKYQPQCLINNRIGHNLGDYNRMRDNQIPVDVRGEGSYWEVPATLNNTWGFKLNDHNWKNPNNLIFKLVDIVSKGGNYLLNVGPDADRVIPKASQQILRKVGDWLIPNGEAIYCTDHSPFYPKGINWRCTIKPNTLYFHILKAEDTIVIKGLESHIISARFLASNEKVNYRQSKNDLQFYLPKSSADQYNTIIKVKISDAQPKIKFGFGWNDPQEIIEMHSKIARIRGESLKYNEKSESINGFFGPRDELWWNLRTVNESNYRIDIEYSCEEKSASGQMNLQAFIDEQNIPDEENFESSRINYRHKIVPTNRNGEFVRVRLGEVRMIPKMNYRFFFGADSTNMKIRKIILTRINKY